MPDLDIKNGAGPASALFLNDQTPKPVAGPGQALVKIKAFGLNRMDLLQRDGHYPLPPHFPKTLGVEFSGLVETVADGAAAPGGFRPGDEVFGLAYGGAYAEYIAVPTQMLLHKPSFLSWEQAAGIPETWITATQALFFVGGFREGQTVLWHAGASGVSIAGCQLARRAGAAAVYATVGSDEKCAFVVDRLGATAAFNYKTQDWKQEILGATGGAGVDMVVDFVGADYFQRNLEVAARDGHIVCLGFLSGAQVKDVNIGMLLAKRLRVEGSSLRSRDLDYQEKLRDKLEVYLPDFEKGDLKVYIDKVFPWTDIKAAHEHMESNASTGKIICTIS